MNLPEILSEGPKSYTELRGNLHPEAFDSILRPALKARKVVRLSNGKYALPAKPGVDPPLPIRERVVEKRKPVFQKGTCKFCGGGMYIKYGKYRDQCSRCRYNEKRRLARIL